MQLIVNFGEGKHCRMVCREGLSSGSGVNCRIQNFLIVLLWG